MSEISSRVGEAVEAARRALRRVGLGERRLKTALAAGVAYWLGLMIPHTHSPYLAPLTAILVMQMTIADSVSVAFQRLVGVVLGIPIAVGIAATVGVHPWSVALMVLIGFAIGSALRLGPQGVPQVAVTSLLVMLVGTPQLSYAYTRIIETMVGGAVGILVNALLLPPSHLPRAVKDVTAYGAAVAESLAATADALEAGFTPSRAEVCLARARETEASGVAAATSVAQAAASVRYNYFGRSERDAIQRWEDAAAAVQRARIQSLGVIRTLHDATVVSAADPGWPLDPVLAKRLASALRANATLIRSAVAVASDPSSVAVSSFEDAERQARIGSDLLVDQGPDARDLSHGAWVEVGSVVTDLRRMAQDLETFVAAETLQPSQPARVAAPARG